MAKVTAEQKVEIAELRERGWSYDRIASKFGISASAVHYHCLCQGAVSPNSRGGARRGPQTFVAKDGRTQRRFAEQEDRRMLELVAEGLTPNQIAGKVGRSNTSVRIRLMTLGLRQEGYAANGPLSMAAEVGT